MNKKTSELTKVKTETAKRIIDVMREMKKKSDKELPFGYTNKKS